MKENIKLLTILALGTLFVLINGCKEDEEASSHAKIEHLEGAWMEAREFYGSSNPSDPNAKYRVQVIRFTSCEGDDCYKQGELYKNHTYEYRIEVGIVEEDSSDPFVSGQLVNDPEFSFVYYFNAFSKSQLTNANAKRDVDTLSIIKISPDSLILGLNNLGWYRINHQKFKSATLPLAN